MQRGAVDRVSLQFSAITTPLVVKSHDLGSAALTSLRLGQARAVCTYRDPRDCVASDMIFMKHSFDTSVKRIAASLESLSLLHSIPSVLLIGYEQMMADPRRQIRRIANHLGMDLDDAAVRQIDAQTNLEVSKNICEGLKTQATETVYQSPTHHHRIDSATHLHDNHINGGTVGRWKDELSIDRAIQLTDLFRPWLVKMRYETMLDYSPGNQIDSLSNEFATFAEPGR